jgi:hypothetical protein
MKGGWIEIALGLGALFAIIFGLALIWPDPGFR